MTIWKDFPILTYVRLWSKNFLFLFFSTFQVYYIKSMTIFYVFFFKFLKMSINVKGHYRITDQVKIDFIALKKNTQINPLN